jgi:hypothetical protein
VHVRAREILRAMDDPKESSRRSRLER